jgi:hypothetical protein
VTRAGAWRAAQTFPGTQHAPPRHHHCPHPHPPHAATATLPRAQHLALYVASLTRSVLALHDLVANKAAYRDVEEGGNGAAATAAADGKDGDKKKEGGDGKDGKKEGASSSDAKKGGK